MIDPAVLAEDVHGFIACTDCHGGQDVADKQQAHDGMIADPSEDAVTACGECHPDIAPFQERSLHNNLAGYDTVLYERSLPGYHPIIEEGEQYHCNSCHTTCGQCHISQPTSVGGGLVNGHEFMRTPSMSQNCTACHGSRVKNEYTGAHEGLSADVHLRSARMVCTDCHTGGEMHGTDYLDVEIAHRYDGAQGPSCESCHQDQVGIGSGNPYHEAHGTEILSCQTCHSLAYANCYECHLNQTDEGVPYFQLQEEDLGFYIGRNTIRTPERPYRFVPVRHVPAWAGLFDYYGGNVLSNFEARPTWAYATPHNIQLRTPQTESCENCHGSSEYFLTPDKVRPEELDQNASVIVPAPPPLPDAYDFTSGEPSSSGTGQESAPSTDPMDAPADPMDAPADPMDAPADPMDAPASAPDPLDG